VTARTVKVCVLPGHVVYHDGQAHGAGAVIELSAQEAKVLEAGGSVEKV
jgi:hypothetical protein